MAKNPISPTYAGYITLQFKEGVPAGDMPQITNELGISAERIFKNEPRDGADRFFRIRASNLNRAEDLAARLADSGYFESVYIENRIIPAASINTPDFEPQQDFLEAMHIYEARDFEGGYGEDAFIIDCESTGNFSHEDVNISEGLLFGAPGAGGYQDHATAIYGILTGKDDGHGITGIVPSVKLGAINWYSVPPAAAIDAARMAMKAGDILLLEGQVAGPPSLGECSDKGEDGCVPVEYNPAIFAAIKYATADGIIVVECAGNGGNDLDSDIFNGAFDPLVKHSGAIIVGAGSGAMHWPTSFTNYGARVDLQGLGTNVATTGYGDLYNGGMNKLYTGDFKGTSPAAAMVAGAIAILQSTHKAAYSDTPPLTSDEVLSILHETGFEQGGTKHIGPLPDVNSAIESHLGIDTQSNIFKLLAPIKFMLPKSIICWLSLFINGYWPENCI